MHSISRKEEEIWLKIHNRPMLCHKLNLKLQDLKIKVNSNRTLRRFMKTRKMKTESECFQLTIFKRFKLLLRHFDTYSVSIL